MPSKTGTLRLTQLQRDFVREFVSNPDPHIRGNTTNAFKAAGGKWRTDASARASAARMLTYVNVRHAIQVAQIQADAVMLTQLVDWKTAAIEAQPHLLALIQGILPNGDRIQNRTDAAIAQVMLGALKEVMDRGFPKSLYVKVDSRLSLARLLGVSPESLPASLEDEA
jgi:hypothetical protein